MKVDRKPFYSCYHTLSLFQNADAWILLVLLLTTIACRLPLAVEAFTPQVISPRFLSLKKGKTQFPLGSSVPGDDFISASATNRNQFPDELRLFDELNLFDTPSLFTSQDEVPQPEPIRLRGGLTPRAIGWTVAIILALAECLSDDPTSLLNGRQLGFNILDAALPLTPTDAVAVTVGEVAAGAVAPFVSLAVVSLLPLSLKPTTRDLGQAVADADFLVTRAASLPILQSLGLPPALARALSGLVALLPSQLVKTAARSRDESVRDELEKELDQEFENKFFLFKPFQEEPSKPTKVISDVAIELFSDILKWLSYGVLCLKCQGALNPFSDIAECAAFGVVANVGAQCYIDAMDAFLLGEAERERIHSRTLNDWKSLYLSQGVCGAALFGIYEWVQAPATQLVSTLLHE